MSASIEIVAIAGMAEIEPGADLGALIVAAAHAAALELGDGDIVCISQKAVSKAEDRFRVLAEVEPGARAQGIAAELDRDPRLVELVLAESRRIVRATAAALIVERNDGWICANAGIDASNVGRDGAVLLLPADADASARRIRTELERACGARPGVLVSRQLRAPVASRPGGRRDRLRRGQRRRRLARARRHRRSRADRDRDRPRRSARRRRRSRSRQGLARAGSARARGVAVADRRRRSRCAGAAARSRLGPVPLIV